MKKCFTCNKEFSDDVEFCPQCNNELVKISTTKEENKVNPFSKDSSSWNILTGECIWFIFCTLVIDSWDLGEIYLLAVLPLIANICIVSIILLTPIAYPSPPTKTQPTIKCPMCGSLNTQRISTTHKVVSTSLMGLASSDIGKQYECKNCKHKW